MKNLGDGTKQLFDKLSPTKGTSKKLRFDTHASDADENENGVPTGHTSFNEQDKEFLKELVGHMNVAVDTKVAAAVNPLKGEVDILKAQVEATTKTLAELRKAQEALKAEQQAQRIQTSSLAETVHNMSQGSQGSQSSNGSRLAPGRIFDGCYTMGSLGRDACKDDIESKAREVLTEIGAPTPQNLYAPYVYGSQVTIEYVNASDFAKTRSLLIEKKKFVEGQTHAVWIDVKKSRQERLPGVILREAQRIIKSHNTQYNYGFNEVLRCGGSSRIYGDRRDLGRYNRTSHSWEWQANHGLRSEATEDVERTTVNLLNQ